MTSKNPYIKQIDNKMIVGFAVRTLNSDEFNPETAKIPQLWQQFSASHLADEMAVVSVYSDYESDANGQYTVTVGVTTNDQYAELSTIQIHSGNYLVFEGKGTMPQAVIETWKRVWHYFTEESQYQRRFLTDFEMYNDSDEVAIYIGIK